MGSKLPGLTQAMLPHPWGQRKKLENPVAVTAAVVGESSSQEGAQKLGVKLSKAVCGLGPPVGQL